MRCREGELAQEPVRALRSLFKVTAAARPRRSRPTPCGGTFENLARLAGVDQMVRRSLAGWRSEEAQAIYAGVGREEREKAGTAMVRLVEGSKR